MYKVCAIGSCRVTDLKLPYYFRGNPVSYAINTTETLISLKILNNNMKFSDINKNEYNKTFIEWRNHDILHETF